METSARPVSASISVDTDVNLDFLTKEEREALLSKKMDMIRQRNKALSERHQMIEADKKKAEEAGNAVKMMDSKSLPAEGAPKGRGRGRGQSHPREQMKPAKERPKSSGDFRDSSQYEPIVDTSEITNYRGRGRGSFHDRDGPPTTTPKNRRRAGPKDEGGHSGQTHRPNSRRQDDGRSERGGGRRKDMGSNRPVSGDHGPPPDPSFNPLADRRRSENRPEKKEDSNADHRRHPRNYGGGADLTKVKQTMRTMREKERERPSPNKPLDLVMTGKERRNHEEWKKERERVDKERIQRQMDDTGGWRRAWDVEKIHQDFDDAPYGNSRVEPAKRPAGRIGSGRFDRGEREERPRSAVIGKGGLQQYPPNSPTISHSHQPQQSQPPAQQPSPMSPGSSGGKGRGRGRGRGRARGAGTPGDTGGAGIKSARPRTWSGGEDNRLVECQKEMLLVKFDNTAGDNSVEVEYEDAKDLPSPTSPVKSTPGRGPTGRTPNQSPTKQRREGAKQGKHKSRHRGSKHEADDASQGSGHQRTPTMTTTENGDGVPGVERVRTTSNSHSYGDSEEWEDCTESSGLPEDEQDLTNSNLHLECKLNPEAPEFLPTSPDFLKTPPGHVKVLNWAADGSGPTSPQSCLSPRLSTGSAPGPGSPSHQPARTSPRVDSSSTTSSPGSSASVKAARRRAMLLEEVEADVDCCPDGDDPHPPPFLLMAAGAEEKASAAPMADKEEEEEEEEEEEKFEDVPEVAPDTEHVTDSSNGAANLHNEDTSSKDIPDTETTETKVDETNDPPKESLTPKSDDSATPSDSEPKHTEVAPLSTEEPSTEEAVTSTEEAVTSTEEAVTSTEEAVTSTEEAVTTSQKANSSPSLEEELAKAEQPTPATPSEQAESTETSPQSATGGAVSTDNVAPSAEPSVTTSQGSG